MEIVALRGFTNVHLKGYRFKIGGQGIIGHVSEAGKMHYAPDVRTDPYYVVSESNTLSELDIPLIGRERLIGIFNAQSSSLDAFSPEQIELLRALADTIAIAIENARLFRQERREKEKALREQAEARQIQRALLPEADPIIEGYAVSGMCLQLSAVGGDWYDYVRLGDALMGNRSRRRMRQGHGGSLVDVGYAQPFPLNSRRVTLSIRSPCTPEQVACERPSNRTVRYVGLSGAGY
jgi:phosphoserine phosphatase RsbU/P